VTVSATLKIATEMCRLALSAPDWLLGPVNGKPIRVDGGPLSPPAQLLIRLEQMVPRAAPHTVDIVRSRVDFDIACSVLLRGVARDVQVEDHLVDGAAGPLRARMYTPRGVHGPQPLLIFFHGGGFVLGSLTSHDGICRVLSKHSGVRLLAVEYRLAPEHPFPAAVDDAFSVFRHVSTNAERFGASRELTGVGGDSAGGTLAAVVAQRCLDEGVATPAFSLMLYPAVDGVGGHPSRHLLGRGYFVDSDTIAWYQTMYTPGVAVPDDPYMSPLRARDLRGLPPAVVVTAGFDPFRDEAFDYVGRMRAAGTRVRHVHHERLMHGFGTFAGCDRHAARAFREAAVELGSEVRLVQGVGELQSAVELRAGD
jgi:acetyl esterase